MTMIAVYGSRYGTTKSYAEEYARQKGIKAIPFRLLEDLTCYDTVIHFGALLAGGVYGLKKTLKLLDATGAQHLVIVTVGLADPKNSQNTDYLKQAIKEQVPTNILNNTEIYHLRGGIDYKKLSLVHRFMMYLTYKKAKKHASESNNEETNEMIATYNKKVSFVDFNTLDQIVIKDKTPEDE
ncbi:flavodoxin domain-containing protein [Jeotgalibaca sp. A127]|uniref:flavodoxin domain-containing protein n=1 Tax=Jeotgalibaca sp. A127 TaxID=3457324 RepID=UPI003FD18E11